MGWGACGLAVLLVARGVAAEPVADGDRALAERGISGCERAVESYRLALAAAPDDPELQLKLADALNCVMRIRTNGNALLVEGRSDTPDHRAIWKATAPEAVRLARSGRARRADDAWALSIYSEAYMFEASSQGIIEAILKGAAGEYKRNAQALIDHHPRYENGGGYLHLGSFYFVAPWPLADPEKGLALLEQAIAVAPHSRRNHYFAGVGAFRLEKYPRAAAHFEAVHTGTCVTPTERDFCDFVTAESARLLPIARTQAARSESAP
jgi:tetratricopeptide (TPR) repeat protein